MSNLFLSLTIAILVESLGVVGSGVSAVAAFLTGSAASTLNLAVVFGVAGVVASLVGVTSVSFLPTPVVFCVVSFAFVCLSLSWGFVATTFSSALVVVAEAGAPPEAEALAGSFANFNSFAGSANELSLLS